MATIDYKKLGLRCGLEIHQQLDTGKLFCRCPSILRDDKPDVIVKRTLRAVSGELGAIDVAALHETMKNKFFLYEAYSDTTCLVELDEEPPQPMDAEALKTVLQISKMLNAKIVDEIQVMRKTVVDGSNTSGFQRTALVARNGHIDVSGKKISIPTICIEEDSARHTGEDERSVKFRLDRLGIPLIEIATGPEINSPEEAKIAAEKIGMILRSTKVKRGIGTIRQDLNVSIKGGARVEIKGVQELKLIPRVVEKEAERQLELLNKKMKVNEEVRRVNEDATTTFMRPMPGAARMYPETDIPKIVVTDELLKSIKIPELIEEKESRLEKEYGINEAIASQLVAENKLELFNRLLKSGADPKMVANTLVLTLKDIEARHKLDTQKIKEADLEFVFKSVADKKIGAFSIENILVDIIKGIKPELSSYREISKSEIEKEIKEIVQKNRELSVGALMGLVMNKYRGKVEGKTVLEIINRLKK